MIFWPVCLKPNPVYHETVTNNPILAQRQRITQATENFIQVITPKVEHQFTRKLGVGEQGVLNLALEMQADFLILDDKKARYEATELGLISVFTTDILKWAEQKQYIVSYDALVVQLAQQQIYLPE